jgi:hypothetical protein
MARKQQPSSEFASVFAKLRTILEQHAGSYSVTNDTPERYSLASAPGPATIKAWGGKVKAPMLPVAWVEVRKSYVSYHLMGLYMNHALAKNMSKALSARKQGKSCLNFKSDEPALFKELERLTAESLAGMEKAGFI